MDVFSSIFAWLSDHEAGISAVVGIAVLAGIVFTGIRFLGQGSLTLASTMTVSLAFDRRRGTALGIFSTATSALMALVPVA